MTDHTERPPEKDALEDFFGAARRMAPDPSEALMARVLADALTAQAATDPVLAPPASSPTPARARGQATRPGLLAQLREALGGWPAVGGLATAGVMGLAIGIGAATGLGDLTAALLGQPEDAYLVDLMPELDFDIAMDLSEG